MVRLEPDFGNEDRNFPCLPAFGTSNKSSKLKERVYTHSTMHGRSSNRFQDPPGDSLRDYERLEHIGDAVLGMFVTKLLYDLYPDLTEGGASAIRSMMVSNNNLAGISSKYRLSNSLKARLADIHDLRHNSKVQADLFEAYVGGLYLDGGLYSITPWLKALFEPYARASYAECYKKHELEKLPSAVPGSPILYVALFNARFQKTAKDFDYLKFQPTVPGGPPLWQASVQVGDKVYSSGLFPSRKDARRQAAKKCLLAHGLLPESDEAVQAPTSFSGHLRSIPAMEPPQVSFEKGGTKDQPEGTIIDFFVGVTFLAAILYFVGLRNSLEAASSAAHRIIEYIQSHTP